MFDEARLDDEDAVAALDHSLTLRALAGAGAQVRIALRAAEEAGLERLRDVEPRGVVVAAAGGSAAVADIFVAAVRPGAALPVQACASGPLPGWVGALDVVIAVSQSGRAAGALSMAAEAARRGAFIVTIGAAESPLAEVSARARGVHGPIAVPDTTSRTSMWAQATHPGNGPEAQACTGRAAPDRTAATKMSATAAEPPAAATTTPRGSTSRSRSSPASSAARRAMRTWAPAPASARRVRLWSRDAMASSSSSRASSNTGAAAQPSRRARSTSRTGTPDSIG